jgi:hypothetical protein
MAIESSRRCDQCTKLGGCPISWCRDLPNGGGRTGWGRAQTWIARPQMRAPDLPVRYGRWGSGVQGAKKEICFRNCMELTWLIPSAHIKRNSPTKPSFLAGVQYQGKGSILNNGRDRGSEKNERGKERLREKWVFPFETGFMSVVCHCHVGWPEDRVRWS